MDGSSSGRIRYGWMVLASLMVCPTSKRRVFARQGRSFIWKRVEGLARWYAHQAKEGISQDMAKEEFLQVEEEFSVGQEFILLSGTLMDFRKKNDQADHQNRKPL